MKKIIKYILIFFGLVNFILAQPCFLAKPTLDDGDEYYEGLASNGVTQISLMGDSLIWLGTGGGLSKTSDFGASFFSYFSGDENMARGGISAISVLDSIIWVSAIFDSSTEVGSQQTGGGLAVSKDYGESWNYIPQPVDSVDDYNDIWAGYKTRFLPVVTTVNNTTWDIASTKDYTYIVSWAGGIRRTPDFGQTWQRLPLPSDDADFLPCDSIPYQINPRDPPNGNHNHKGFSVLAYGDTVWVGTAAGINLGIVEPEGCIRWTKFNSYNSAISGNFVVAMARQYWKGKETIWAVTMQATGAGEYRAISKTSDGGRTWSVTLEDERAYSFAFHDSVVYVCTERGLFKSIDSENWALYKPIEDSSTGEKIYSEHIYSAAVDEREGTPYLWLGTGDGIARTCDDGLNWQIFRKSTSTSIAGQEKIYAYPNPFSPTHHNVLGDDGHVRIKYSIESSGTVNFEIYDFAMIKVFSGEKHSILNIGENNEVWNGRDNSGRLVANGTYFVKLIKNINDNEIINWTKLIVVK